MWLLNCLHRTSSWRLSRTGSLADAGNTYAVAMGRLDAIDGGPDME